MDDSSKFITSTNEILATQCIMRCVISAAKVSNSHACFCSSSPRSFPPSWLEFCAVPMLGQLASHLELCCEPYSFCFSGMLLRLASQSLAPHGVRCSFEWQTGEYHTPPLCRAGWADVVNTIRACGWFAGIRNPNLECSVGIRGWNANTSVALCLTPNHGVDTCGEARTGDGHGIR